MSAPGGLLDAGELLALEGPALLALLGDADDTLVLERVTGPDGAALVDALVDALVAASGVPEGSTRCAVTFELTRRGALVHRRTVVVEGGHVRTGAGTAGRTVPGRPEVVVRVTALGFVRLLTGQAEAALEMLAGRLELAGDQPTVLEAGRVLRVPGTGEPLVEPAALDPRAVSTVLVGVSTEHLRAVMAGPFRDVVLAEVARRLPDHVKPRLPGLVRLTVVFRITGAPGGGHDRFVVRVADGAATVTPIAPDRPVDEDPTADRDATVTCSGEDFLRVATGHLNPLTAVLRGQLRVRGDRAKALLLSSAIDIPRPS
ncbi:SCP2 sterol-binding domain-containing protein [Nocardioides sp. CPCC 205120]|uniref:SCP2 sterol-binding domain-containing protein n=1 Tax=Nocardioides sp. CPCC 205120 TaxID=3406462 RepID=UPI003B500179